MPLALYIAVLSFIGEARRSGPCPLGFTALESKYNPVILPLKKFFVDHLVTFSLN